MTEREKERQLADKLNKASGAKLDWESWLKVVLNLATSDDPAVKRAFADFKRMHGKGGK
jgi:hypothetical protein